MKTFPSDQRISFPEPTGADLQDRGSEVLCLSDASLASVPRRFIVPVLFWVLSWLHAGRVCLLLVYQDRHVRRELVNNNTTETISSLI